MYDDAMLTTTFIIKLSFFHFFSWHLPFQGSHEACFFCRPNDKWECRFSATMMTKIEILFTLAEIIIKKWIRANLIRINFHFVVIYLLLYFKTRRERKTKDDKLIIFLPHKILIHHSIKKELEAVPDWPIRGMICRLIESLQRCTRCTKWRTKVQPDKKV